MLVGQANQFLLVGLLGHRGQREEMASLPDQHHLLENRVVEQGCLGLLGWELLAVGKHDDVLGTAADVDLAVADLDDVAGVEPAVGRQHLGGGLGVAPVALHHGGAAHQQFARLGDARFEPIEQLADRTRIVVVLAVAGDDRRRLGQAVALDHLQAQPDEGPCDAQFELRAARRGQAQPAAQFLEDRRRDQRLQPCVGHALEEVRLAQEHLPAVAYGDPEQGALHR